MDEENNRDKRQNTQEGEVEVQKVVATTLLEKIKATVNALQESEKLRDNGQEQLTELGRTGLLLTAALVRAFPGGGIVVDVAEKVVEGASKNVTLHKFIPDWLVDACHGAGLKVPVVGAAPELVEAAKAMYVDTPRRMVDSGVEIKVIVMENMFGKQVGVQQQVDEAVTVFKGDNNGQEIGPESTN